MTHSLKLFDQLLARVRCLLKFGQTSQAYLLLRKLTGFRQLPTSTFGEVHYRLGEICLRRRQFRVARRHLRLARVHLPHVARIHQLLGLAYHHDQNADPARALIHYRRALRLSPHNVRVLSQVGELAVQLGNHEQGIRFLRRAVRHSGSQASVVARLIDGLMTAGQPEEALTAVRQALFVQPRCKQLRQLWMRVQTDLVRQQQETSAVSSVGEEPQIVPFLRPVGEMETQTVARLDEPTVLPGPHLVRMRSRLTTRRAP